jgi:hypothetical protein
MATSPDPIDTIYHALLVECHAIHDRATYARRFHQLMGQSSHIEIPVQFERLYRRSLARQEEPTYDDPRGRQQSRRRRVPHARY